MEALRRYWIAILCWPLLMGGAAGVSFEEPAANTQVSQALHYKIYRKGKSIGDHRVSFSRSDDVARVDIAFSIRVKFLGITAFKMDHEASERWNLLPRSLEELSAVTDRSTGTFKIEVGASGDGYDVLVNGEPSQAPGEVVPTSFTLANHLFTNEDSDIVLLDTLSGMLRPSRILYRGLDEQQSFSGAIGDVRYYEIIRLDTGAVSHKIWYDETEAFIQVGLVTKDGHYVEYRRQSQPV